MLWCGVCPCVCVFCLFVFGDGLRGALHKRSPTKDLLICITLFTHTHTHAHTHTHTHTQTQREREREREDETYNAIFGSTHESNSHLITQVICHLCMVFPPHSFLIILGVRYPRRKVP